MRFPLPPHPDIDKSDWGEGPWQHEPDAVSWTDSRTGLHCAMIRHELFGCWLGYVAVEPGHPLHGRRYGDRIEVPPEILDRERMLGRDFGIMELWINAHHDDGTWDISLLLPAHGSITFSDEDTEGFWWFGFDCCHAYDLSPGLAASVSKRFGSRFFDRDETYRDHDYVYGIVTRLAWALQELRTLLMPQKEGGTPNAQTQ